MSLYKKMLQKGKDAVAAMELPFKVKQEEKKLELSILEKEQVVAQKELALQEAKSTYPLDVKKYIEAQDSLELIERQLTQLRKLQKELFQDEVQEDKN